jgi:Na+-translocating ferredoxin:NAD+ oxidoreductase RnfG subunit
MRLPTMLSAMVSVAAVLAFFGKSFGFVILEQDAAMKQMFPDADKIVTETKKLSADEITKAKERLGGTLVHYQKGSSSAAVEEKLEYTFYFATKGGQKTGVALIEDQPGKWGPVQFILALDLTTAKVKNLAVMSYSEKRVRPIAGRNFLDQFVGKGSSDQLAVHKDIRAISGATISSECACFTVRKAAVLYEILYLKK